MDQQSIINPFLDLEFLNAVEMKNIIQVNKLVQAGANVNSEFTLKNNIFMTATIDCLKYSALIKSILDDNLDMLSTLINLGANVNQLDSYNRSPLMYALKTNNIKIIKLLKSCNAMLNPTNSNGESAFTYALLRTDLNFIKLCIKENPEIINEILPNGNTPLMQLISHHQARLIDIFIELGANPNQKNHRNETALIYAAKNNAVVIVEKLIKKGALFSVRTETEKELFLNLLKSEHHSCIVMLIELSLNNLSLSEIDFIFKSINEVFISSTNLNYYALAFSDIIARKNLISIFKLFKQHFNKNISVDLLNKMIYKVCKYNYFELIQDLTNTFHQTFSPKTIGKSALHCAIRKKFASTLFLLNSFYKNIPPYYVGKIISFVSKEGNIRILNQMLDIPGIESIIANDEGKLLTKIQKKATIEPLLYQPIIDRLMMIEDIFKRYLHIQSLYQHSTPEIITPTALNLDPWTQMLIWITKFYIRNPAECLCFLNNKFEIYIKFNNPKISINLSQLIEQSELAHVFLADDDSDCFAKILDLSEANITEIKQNITDNYTLEGYSLSDAEIFSIYQYTNRDHDLINALLHKDQFKEFEKVNEDRIILFFLKIMFIASGLNKIKPDWTRDPEEPAPNPEIQTYRGERYINHIELQERISRLETSCNGIIQKQRGFASTSINPEVANEFSNEKSQIHYSGLSGKNIAPLSAYHEEEYLQLPGNIHITEHRECFNLHTFKATPVTFAFVKHRSNVKEYQFHILTNKNHLQSYDQTHFHSLPPIFLEGFTEECHYVYKHFLSKPFTDDWLLEDWELDTPFGTVPRPNHGLAHVMRVAQLVPIVVKFLEHYDQHGLFQFSKREIHIIQITALFSVVGRKNEAGFSDHYKNGSGYKFYKQDSSHAFKKYAHKKNVYLMSEEEIEQYANIILKMGNPKNPCPSRIVLTLAHKLDLIRCYNSIERVQTSIYEPLNIYLPDEEVIKLMEYAENLLHATGNRVLCGKQETDYNHSLFYAVNTNVEACLNAILNISVPSPNILQHNLKRMSL